jgi:hypothetical protein
MIDIIDNLPKNNLEKKYFNQIANYLKNSLEDQKFKNIYPNISSIILKNFDDVIDYKKNSLVLMNADEKYRVPLEYYDPNVKFIFKQYCLHYCSKMMPLPLGSPSNLEPKENIPYLNRDIDITFVGQIGDREDIYQLVKLITPYKIKSFIAFTNGFNNGLNEDEYSKILMKSKILVCPKGAASFESFRLYEAAKNGSIVLCVPQPNNWLYKNHPFIVYKDTKELLAKILDILNEKEQFQLDLANKCRKYYEDNWEPEIVSHKILNFIIENKYNLNNTIPTEERKMNFLKTLKNFIKNGKY